MIHTYLIHTCIRCREVLDQYNAKQPDITTTLPCFIKWGQRALKGQNGEDVLTQAIVLFASDADVRGGDFLTINDIRHAVISIIRPQGWDAGGSHLEVAIS